MSFINKLFLPNFLRSYSTDISRIHSFFDILVALYVFTNNSGIDEFSLFYYLTIYSCITFCLRSLQKSLRNYSLLHIFYKISLIYLISSFFAFLINNIFISDIEINIFDYLFLKSYWFYIYLFISHFLTRLLLKIYRKRGGNKRSLLVWGNYNSSKKIFNHILNSKWLGFKIEAWFSPDPEDLNSEISFYKGGFDEMKVWINNNNNYVDTVIISSDNKDLSKVINFFGNTNLNTYYLPSWADSTMKLSQSSIGGEKLLSLWESNQFPLASLFKRLIDIIFGTLILLCLSPLIIFIHFFIRYKTKNHALYKQERYGFNGKSFLIYKFRTMKDADSGFDQNLQQVTKDDNRVTNIGRFLRKYSLDELPQLINVIKGDMSLVGPRPHAVVHNEIYRYKINGYMQRHSIKPGMTGLAQIKGFRGETKNIKNMKDRINADLEYIQNWNLILDFKILVKTFLVMIDGSAF